MTKVSDPPQIIDLWVILSLLFGVVLGPFYFMKRWFRKLGNSKEITRDWKNFDPNTPDNESIIDVKNRGQFDLT